MNTCKACGIEIPKSKKYCKIECYRSTLKDRNKDGGKHILVNGERLTMADAQKVTGKSRHILHRLAISETDPSIRAYPDRDTFLAKTMETMKKNHPQLPSKEEIESMRGNRPLKDIAKAIKVNYPNTFLDWCFYLGIDTSFDQVGDSRDNLSKDVLTDLFKKYVSAEAVAVVAGISPSTALTYARKYDIPILPPMSSAGEKQIDEFVQTLGFSTEKRRQDGVEIDIFIPEKSLGIEYHGVYWHQFYEPNYHQNKYKYCRKHGIKLIQVFESDWIENRSLVESKIKHALGVSEDQKVFARKCEVRKVEAGDVRAVYESYHIQGFKPCERHYALFYNGEVVAALSLNGNKIERYAASCSVIGGFSKMFAFVVSDLSYDNYETFVDLMWSDEQDNQYVKSGFVFQYRTRPNYFWCKGRKLYSRVKFQKHKLTEMPGYSEDKTEEQIMVENGYWKIYDAGHAKLIWTKQKAQSV